VIVRLEDGDAVIVRQADHAELSGRIAAAWGAAPWEAPEPFPSVVVGARRHDDAWLEFDEAPTLNDSNVPRGFYEVDRVLTADMYRRGIDAMVNIDLYGALLVSLHFSGFFHSHWGWEPFALPENFPEPQAGALRDFVDGELDRQDRLRAELDIGGDDERRLACNYFWLQLWDRISLDICRQDQSQPWALEYPETPMTSAPDAERVALKFAMVAPGEYRLTPYPMRAEPLTVHIPAARIAVADYATREQFVGLWRSAPPLYLRATIEPG
jgi:hypothetical protein